MMANTCLDLLHKSILKNDFKQFISLLLDNRKIVEDIKGHKIYGKNLLHIALEEKKDYFIKELIHSGFIYPENIAILLLKQSKEIVDLIHENIKDKFPSISHHLVEYSVFISTSNEEIKELLHLYENQINYELIINHHLFGGINSEIKDYINMLYLNKRIKNKEISTKQAQEGIWYSLKNNDFNSFISYLGYLQVDNKQNDLLLYALENKKSNFIKELIFSGYLYPSYEKMSQLLEQQDTHIIDFIITDIIKKEALGQSLFDKDLISSTLVKLFTKNSNCVDFFIQKYNTHLNYSLIINNACFLNINKENRQKIYIYALSKKDANLTYDVLCSAITNKNELKFYAKSLDLINIEKIIHLLKLSIINEQKNIFIELVKDERLSKQQYQDAAALCVQKKSIELIQYIPSYKCSNGYLINTMKTQNYFQKDVLHYVDINKDNLIALLHFPPCENMDYLYKFKYLIDNNVLESIVSSSISEHYTLKYLNYFGIEQIKNAQSLAIHCVNMGKFEILKYIVQCNKKEIDMSELMVKSYNRNNIKILDFLIEHAEGREDFSFIKNIEFILITIFDKKYQKNYVNNNDSYKVIEKLLSLIDGEKFYKKFFKNILPQDMDFIKSFAEKQKIQKQIDNSFVLKPIIKI